MMDVGRLCIKIAGRDAGKKCVIVDVIDKNYVLIDGDVRRKKCNVSHLEPLNEKIDLKKKAPHEEVIKEFRKLGIEVREKKPKQKTERPEKLRQKKEERQVLKGKVKKEKKSDK